MTRQRRSMFDEMHATMPAFRAFLVSFDAHMQTRDEDCQCREFCWTGDEE